jgi:hypothetical protein
MQQDSVRIRVGLHLITKLLYSGTECIYTEVRILLKAVQRQ